VLFLRRRRDSTSIFYDILYLAQRGTSKTRIRRELGLTFQQSEERLGFLLANGYLRSESGDRDVTGYVTTIEGYRLLYFMSCVGEKLASFLPHRKGKEFDQQRRLEIEKGLTDMLFSPPLSTPARKSVFSEWSEERDVTGQVGTRT